MSAVLAKFHTGPITFEAEEAVTGGQVVEAGSTDRTIKPAAAGSAKVLGVALIDAEPKGEKYTGTPNYASVAMAPAHVPVEADGGVAPGDLVVAADGGKVTKADDAAPQAQIVGRVIETLNDKTVSVRLYC